jgi:signal transduction histidine kinase
MRIFASANPAVPLTATWLLLAAPVWLNAQEQDGAAGLQADHIPAKSAAIHHVLILNSFNEDTEPYAPLTEGFMRELQSSAKQQIHFQQFDLQQRQVGSDYSEALRAQLLQTMYGDYPPELVVAVGPPAIRFWLDYRDTIFPQAKTLVTASEQMLARLELRPGDNFVANRFSYPEIVDHILQVLPATRKIMIVFGANENERQLAGLARHSLQAYEQRIEFTYTNDMSLYTLQDQLSNQDSDSAVLFGIFDRDVDGMVLGGKSSLAVVNAASTAPVFGFFEAQLGLGIVGGPLIGLQDTILALASTALDLLQQGKSEEPHKVLPLNAPVYDWRELQQWQIDADLLPPDSIVLFKPPGLWREYAWWIVLAVALMLAEAALIANLWLQHKQKLKAEKDNQSLRGRLITAHEDEQRRIARELHDDLSQRLARLSIDAGYLAHNPFGKSVAEIAREMQPRLVSLSKDVHDMSVLLHPSMIDDLGIAAALSSECERINRRKQTAIDVQIGKMPQDVPHDTALAVFRIAQEALNNAVRHAQAARIELSLDFDGKLFTLKVADNGKGFNPSSRSASHGLGLFSMPERATLVNGTLQILSTIGKGTTVLATIPLRRVPA